MSTTLVTGASGFVGSQVVEELLARGAPVRALVRSPGKAAQWRQRGIEVIVGDVRDPIAVRRAVRGIDVVQHCAAAVGEHFSAQELRQTNLGALRQLLEQARAARVDRVVLLSSVDVLGTLDLDPATEDLPYDWSNDPAADVRIMAELVALEAACRPGPKIVILRLGRIYGPGDQHNLPRLIRAVRRGRFAYIGSRDHVIPIVHVGDVVQAMSLAAQAPGSDGRIYLISDGSRTTVGQFIDHLADLLRCSPARFPDSAAWFLTDCATYSPILRRRSAEARCGSWEHPGTWTSAALAKRSATTHVSAIARASPRPFEASPYLRGRSAMIIHCHDHDPHAPDGCGKRTRVMAFYRSSGSSALAEPVARAD